MELNYFKTMILGDCYVLGEDYDNIISISKNNFSLIGDGNSIFEGFCKPLEVSEEDYNKLKESAEKGDRKQGITLFKKIHEENSGVINAPFLISKLRSMNTVTNPELERMWMRHSFDAEPILD